jgi:peroxiredoxin
MKLGQRLEQFREGSRQRLGPVVFGVYDQFIAHLRDSGFTDRCLKAGDRLPEFALPNAEGRMITSQELLARGPLVISFFRGDWCPYCSMELQALSEILPEINLAGATLVAVTPDTAGHPLRTKQRFGLQYEVLSDVDNGLGLRFGVVFLVPDSLRTAFGLKGIDLAQRHSGGGLFLPIPATYVCDATGTIRHADLDPDYRRRMEPDDLVELLAGLRVDRV